MVNMKSLSLTISTVISKVKVFYLHHSNYNDPSFLLAVNSDELSSLSKLDCDVSAAS